MTVDPTPVALVTGAGSGIGAAIARRLALPGRALVLHTGHNAAGVEATAAACTEAGAGPISIVIGDLADERTIVQLITAADALGALQAVVANAGAADRTLLADLTPAALAHAWQGYVASLAALLRAGLPRLAAHGVRGRFVAISSFVAHRYTAAASTFPATAAAKAAIEALVKAAAVEAAPTGVTVNAVAPGYVRKDRPGAGALDPAQWQQATSRIPLGRLALPADIAGAVAFLLGADAAYITGQVLRVDGGLTL